MDNRLARKLFWIVLIKLAVIFGLWWLFIRDQQVATDAAVMAEILQSTTNGEPPHAQ